MQATTRFHDDVPYPILQKADVVFHDPIALHSTNGVLNADADRGNTTIRGFLRGCEFPSRRFFLGLDDRDVRQGKALEAFVLIQATARWQGIARALCQAFIGSFTLRGVAQEAHMTDLVDHEEVFECVTLLLATLIDSFNIY